MTTWNRRAGVDRRSRPTPLLSRHSLWGGRRTSCRRLDDPPNYYVDRLGAGTWLLLLTIFLFQVLDAYLTLAHLQRGGSELNPLMDELIGRSEPMFLVVKLGVSAIGLWFLGAHKQFPLVRPGLALIFVMFLGVVGWHCFLALNT